MITSKDMPLNTPLKNVRVVVLLQSKGERYRYGRIVAVSDGVPMIGLSDGWVVPGNKLSWTII